MTSRVLLYAGHEQRGDDGSDGYKAGQLRIEIFLADVPPYVNKEIQTKQKQIVTINYVKCL